MSNLDSYLATAGPARRQTMFVSTGVGASVGALAQGLGVPSTAAVVLCVAATCLVEVVSALFYTAPASEEPREFAQARKGYRVRRRDLLRAGLSTAALLILSALRVPRVTAASLEHKLLEA